MPDVIPFLVSMQIIISFFLYYYGDRRDLHSFPTRRSSDLGQSVRSRRVRARWLPLHRRVERWRRHLGRSEEHTSELQSRQYLVCRLLLEKKKSWSRCMK